MKTILVLGTIVLFGLSDPIGGFELTVETPSKNGSYSEALLVVRTRGCARPEDATVEAHATRSIDGRPVEQKLRLNRVRKGVYTIERQWPEDGAWLVTVTGRYRGHTSSLLVGLDENASFDGQGSRTSRLPNGYPVRVLTREIAADDVAIALRSLGD